MNVHGTGTTGEKPLASTPLIVRIGYLDPRNNLARLDRILEVSCVPGDEPMTESILKAVCS